MMKSANFKIALEMNKAGGLKGAVVVQIHPDSNKTTVKVGK